jgi:hypothetical protein
MKTLAGEHDAGVRQLLVVLAHVSQDLGIRHGAGFRFLARLHDDHDSHLQDSFEISSFIFWSNTPA